MLAERVDELPVEKQSMKVTLHDSCHLGREFGLYEEPRKVIKKFAELVEMPQNRANSLCCGGGGGVRANYPELSLDMAKKRVSQKPEEADYIVTTCPLCQRNLQDAGGKVEDIAVLLGNALKE
jgi:Fe-S oxidoreductase